VPARRDEAITDEYVVDAENFKDKIKSDYLKYRSEFRQIMDNIRTTEYESFAKIGLERAQTAENKEAKRKFQSDKEAIMDRLKATKGDNTRAMFHDLFH